MTMNPKIKADWVAALRSGEYEQGTGKLNQNGKFCCLGVLCDLAVKADVGVTVREERISYIGFESHRTYYDGNPDTTPDIVQDWAGLPDEDPVVRFGVSWSTPANLNDSGMSFADIADIIEEQL